MLGVDELGEQIPPALAARVVEMDEQLGFVLAETEAGEQIANAAVALLNA